MGSSPDRLATTIVYVWMPAVGIVNDHALHCFRRDQVAREHPVRRGARR
jgi:hypothetical protein